MDKWKQLQKYIEPLKRMINKIEKDEGRCCLSPLLNDLDLNSVLYTCILLANLSFIPLFVLFSERKKELQKLKNLLNILSDSTQRCDTLPFIIRRLGIVKRLHSTSCQLYSIVLFVPMFVYLISGCKWGHC